MRSAGPQQRGQNHKWLPHSFSRGHKRAELLRNACILGGPQQRGQNHKWLPHPYLPRGPQEGGLGPQQRGQNHKWLPHPCLLRGPKEGQIATQPRILRVPNKGDKIRNGYPTPPFSGAQQRAELQQKLCVLGGPQQRGEKSQVATSFLPCRGPKRGRNCYATLAFSGVPNKRDKITSGYLTPAFSRANKRAELLRNPCILGGPQQRGQRGNICPARPARYFSTNYTDFSPYITPSFSGVSKKGTNSKGAT